MQWKELLSHLRHLDEPAIAQVHKAFTMAKDAHADQKRKSGDPYFSHPIAVAHILADMSADGDTIAAALLHDTVEDTPLTLQDIEATFGSSVATLVDGVTKLCLERTDEHIVTLDETIETLRKIFTLTQQDVRIMVIKLADRLHNMQTLEFLSEHRRMMIAQETRDVYVKIADRLSMQDLHDELEQLTLGILDPSLLPHLEQLRSDSQQLSKSITLTLALSLGKSHPQLAQHCRIEYECKSLEESQKQLSMRGSVATGNPILSVVFACETTSACYEMLGALHQHWKRETLSFQDYINSPHINGYRGLHTTIILQDGTRVRCKIRTQSMHEYARRGITTLCFKGTAQDISQEFPWAKSIGSLSTDTKDRSEEFWDSLQSDILGESIIIHGPDDRTVLLPTQATALDGAFYLFGEKALYADTILVNGHPAHFSHALSYADSLTCTFAHQSTATLEWLSFVKSGTAQAHIRRALSHAKPEEKLRRGKELITEHLRAKGRGFLSEFTDRDLDLILGQRGVISFAHACIGVTEGRYMPEEIEKAIFGTKRKHLADLAQPFTLRFQCPPEAQAKVATVLEGIHTDRVTYRLDASGMLHARIRVRVDEAERRFLLSVLTDLLPSPPALLPALQGYGSIVSFIFLFLLWGIDPVFASLILTKLHVMPVELHFLRFLSLAGMSAVILLWHRLRSPITAIRLPLRNATLWACALLLLIVSLSTYLSLRSTAPMHYILLVAISTLCIAQMHAAEGKRTMLMRWALIGVSVLLLIVSTTNWNMIAIINTFIAAAAWALFTICSEYYKQKEQVHARIVQYFFLLSILCLMGSLPLLSLTSFSTLSLSTIALCLLFVTIFSSMPYFLFHLLPSQLSRLAVQMAVIVLPITFIAQMLFVAVPSVFTLIASLGIVVAGILPLFRTSYETKVAG